MSYKITYKARELIDEISIPGSKSISNRLLILKHLLGVNTEIENLSTSNDTKLLLESINSKSNILNLEDAGTTFRFLTAFLAYKTKFPVILTGSDRMKHRPIKQLVDMLIQLGAKIEYLDEIGFPSILIKPSDMIGGSCYVPDGEIISSQYLSALIMIGPFMKNGLTIVAPKRVSESYLQMTISLMNTIGFKVDINKDKIEVGTKKPTTINNKWIVESDWSSASYWYLIMALSNGGNIKLNTLIRDSLQGDSVIRALTHNFVDTHFNDYTINLTKLPNIYFGKTKLDKYGEWCPIVEQTFNMGNTPDLAPTLAVLYSSLGIKIYLNELSTLKIKECDRLVCLKSELSKVGVNVSITNNSLITESINLQYHNEVINTFNDHRMIMSFIPFAMVFIDGIIIDDISHIKKSYPSYIEDIQKIGFIVEEIN